ncbi:hypothetical protein BOX15_Mlig002606g1 [Macrostomum lignano]|uniref:Uncharacterized protein n=1 Tax=Macrostomum lignano TaxID=282301 RepID=A0A267DL17_9PLAT|nr:hypothetical protein BOX15_Mlig002606g1 [Macrostomum lignano]
MWQGSVELLMPDRRGEVPQRGSCSRRQSRKKTASATASVSVSSRSISRRLHELQLLSRRLRQGDTVQLSEQKEATLRNGRVEPIRTDQPSPRLQSSLRRPNRLDESRRIEICIEFLVSRTKQRRRRQHPHRRSVAEQSSNRIQRQSVEEQPSNRIQRRSVEEQPSNRIQRRSVKEQPSNRIQRRSVKEQPSNRIQRRSVEEQPSNRIQCRSVAEQPSNRNRNQLSVRSKIPLPLTDQRSGLDQATRATSTFSLGCSEGGSFSTSRSSEGVSLVQLRQEHCQFLEATLVPLKAGGPQRGRNSLLTLRCLPDNAMSLINRHSQASTGGTESRGGVVELTSESPTLQKTPKKEPSGLKNQALKKTTSVSRRCSLIAHCLTETGWPSFVAEDAPMPQLRQARYHQGQRPVISCAILGADLAGRFATQHRPPMQLLPGAICKRRPPQPSQQFSQALMLPTPRLPSVAEAVLVQLPREVAELSTCSLNQFTGLPGSAARRSASHRLLLRPPGFARVAKTFRFAAKTLTITSRLGPMAPVCATIDEPQSIEGASAVGTAGRCFFYAASHCLRLSVGPVTEPGVRRLRPLPSDGGHVSSELALASASNETVISSLVRQSEEEKQPVKAVAPFAGDVGGDIGGFNSSKAVLSDASGDRQLLSDFAVDGLQQQGEQ